MAFHRRHVSRDVINAVKDLNEDAFDPTLRWLTLGDVEIDHFDAIYITGFLDGQLELQQELTENKNNNNNAQGRMMGLYLNGARLTDDAVEVICDFLQDASSQQRMALCFNLPPVQCRRLLRALHTNTSVKHLQICCGYDGFEEDELGRWISDLLRNKTDFEGIFFGYAHFPLSHLLDFLRHGHAHLKKLGLGHCDISDDGVRLIVEALMDGNHQGSLEEFAVNCNNITSRGLSFLCALAPSAFPCINRLDLKGNATLMDDPTITQRFIQEVLLATDSILEAVSIAGCSTHAAGYRMIIKALATHRTLLFLDITNEADILRSQDYVQLIRDQLIESIPKMNGIQHFVCDEQFVNENDHELMKAFTQNSSMRELSIWSADRLYHVPVATPFLVGILKRNEDLARVDGLLGTRASIPTSSSTASVGRNTPTTVIPRSLWPHALAKVGSSSNGSNTQGASPVFKILQARLASWPETNEIANTNASKKRKRQDANEEKQR